MKFAFLVEAEVNFTTGKFASRDELAEQIMNALESADPSSLEGSEGGEYSVDEWNVSEQQEARKRR